MQTRYLWGNSGQQLLAQINVGRSAVSFALQDRLGSVRDLTDGSNVLDNIQYAPFGTVTTQTNPANGSIIGYAAQDQDTIAGVLNSKWRTLLASSDQWIQTDPLSISSGQTNFRQYVGNNPINFSDPTGLTDSISASILRPETWNNPTALRLILQDAATWGLSEAGKRQIAQRIAELTAAAIAARVATASHPDSRLPKGLEMAGAAIGTAIGMVFTRKTKSWPSSWKPIPS